MALKRPARQPRRTVPDDAVLTQYGRVSTEHPTFRSSPRPGIEIELSLILGARTVDDAALLVTGHSAERTDRVRHVRAGALRAAGFLVESSPTRRNPDHVSVTVPDGVVPWDDRTRRLFDRCFVREGGEA